MGILDDIIGGQAPGQPGQGAGAGMGGGLGGLMGALSGSGGAGGGVLGAILGAVQSHPGGLGGLLSSFQQAGMGDQAASWVQDGPNQDVSPGQVQSALGGGFIEQIASKLGLPPGAAAAALAQYLPQIVDHLTPGGQLPQDGGADGLGGLLGRLGGR